MMRMMMMRRRKSQRYADLKYKLEQRVCKDTAQFPAMILKQFVTTASRLMAYIATLNLLKIFRYILHDTKTVRYNLSLIHI